MNEKKLQQLKFYAARGFPIFPVYWMEGECCACGDKNCKSPGKHPMVSGGFYSASLDPNQVKAWHEKWPDANWGMRTGDKSAGGAGVLIVDIDQKSGCFEAWDMLEEENPKPRFETVTVRTGGGGEHLWFTYPDGVDIPSAANVLGPACEDRLF